ncbi:MAG: MoaD/ThiS family protein [Gammaproteobacteria bacterium]|nr:MoaD/ThiS family protein [Gammaproteobacteria bacterium]
MKLIAIIDRRCPPDGGVADSMIELAPGATTADARVALDPPAAESNITLVNGEIVRAAERAGRRLAEDDALTVFPPIKGG